MAAFASKADWERFYSFKGEPYGRPATRPGIRLHYNDWIVGGEQVIRAQHLKTLHGLGSGIKAVVVGAGFGWSVEGLALAGVEAIGTDISAWIQSAKATSEEGDLREYISAAGVDPDNDWILGPPGDPRCTLRTAEHNGRQEWMIRPLDLFLTRAGARTTATVIDEDGHNNQSLRAIANQLAGSVDVVFTEEVLNSLTDNEALTVCDYMQNLLSRHGNSGAKIVHILSPLDPDAVRQDPALNWKTFADWRALLDANGFSAHVIQDGRGARGLYRGDIY